MLQLRIRPHRLYAAGDCGPPCPARAVPPPSLPAPLSAEAVQQLLQAESAAYAAYLVAHAAWLESRCSNTRLQHAVSLAYRNWRAARQAVEAGQIVAPAIFAPFAALLKPQ